MFLNYIKSNLKLILISYCLTISLFVIIGWLFNIEFILIYLADEAGMKFNTALFFLTISTLVLLDILNLTNKVLKNILLLSILILSSYTLIEYFFETTFTIDNIFVKDYYNSNYPGRMSIGTAACFMLLTSGVLLTQTEKQKAIVNAQHLFAIIIFISGVSLTTHILNIPNENRSMFLDTMSIFTSFFFLIYSIICSLKHKNVGIFSVFFTNLIGSKLLKTLIPVIFLLPILLSYLLIFAISESVLKNDFGIVLHTIFLITITFSIIAYISKNLNATDRKRNDLENLLQQTNKELTKLNNELKEKNKDLKQFVYIASHDLQEPLRTVTSISEMLEEEYKNSLDDNGKVYINFIKEGIGRMHLLVKDLMDYSRLGTKLEFNQVDLNIVLTNIKNDLALKIKENNVTLNYNKLPKIVANESAIGQLFQNLISNAIKFTKKDINPIINIYFTEENEFWKFSVADNGIGFEKKDEEKVFQIFKRLHTEKEFPGTGIGLANCKKIIELHNGKIWANSTLNVGSTFHFTIKK